MRLLLAYASRGTQDVSIWRMFAAHIDQYGLRFVYEHEPHYNHPPLIGRMAALALDVARSSGLPFHFVFKIPSILAEFLTASLLWKIWSARSAELGWRAVMLFSCNLASILVSGFHGSTDCLCASLCLLAAYLIDERREYFLGGLALGGAINVKLIPLVCIPAILVGCRSRRERVACVSGLALAALPFVPYLIECGGAFYDSVLAYNSSFGYWGIPLLLKWGFSIPRLEAASHAAADVYTDYGRGAILGCILILSAWMRTRLKATALIGLSLAVFLVLTPGFGPQYTVYVIPLWFALDLGAASLYALIAGTFIGLIYWSYLTPGFPLYSPLGGAGPLAASVLGLVAWSLIGRWLVQTVWRARPGRPLQP